jgi:hypothetical protein
MIDFKDNQVKQRSELLHYKMVQIMIEMKYYCDSYGMPFVVTATVSTIDEDAKLGRTSSSHRECRAIDLRTFHWPESFVQQFIEHFTGKYYDLGAVSESDKKRRFIVDKSKTKSPHLHVQLDKIYSKAIAWKH